eukprot:COSAG06_NODE_42326_length_382_cov_5.872792_1_plen_87_part_01
MLASVVVVPLAGRWCYLSWSWYTQLWPTLQAMRDQAANFTDQHSITGEFKAAVQASGVTGVTHPCITGLLTPASSPCSPLHQRAASA